jgi:hypothetical protein
VNRLSPLILVCLGLAAGCTAPAAEQIQPIRLSSHAGDPTNETTNTLLISSPWNAGERLSLNFPEHCWGRGLPNVSHSSTIKIDRPWNFNTDSTRAWFEYSPRAGVLFRAEARVESLGVRLLLDLENSSDTALTDIRTLVCLRPEGMLEFRDTSYALTCVAVEGRPLALGRETHYPGPLAEDGRPCWALNVAGGPDNLSFDDLGWFKPGSGPGRIVEERADPPLIAIHSRQESLRWLGTVWQPARLVFSNPRIPCIHSDPLPPDCPPGGRSHAEGLILFHRGSFETLLERARAGLAQR